MKGLIIFLAGAAVGGIVGALVTKEVLQKKYKKASDDKIKSMQEYVEFLRSKDEAGKLAENLDYVEKKGESIVKTEINPGVKNRKNVSNVAYTDYTQFYKKDNVADAADKEHPSEDEDGGEEKMKEKIINEMHKSMNEYQGVKVPPKLIKSEEYDDPTFDYHDHVTLYYYTEDGTLATEDDEIIDDIPAYVGDCLTKFGFDKNDEEVIFVRNVNRSTDYEVAKVFGAFGE